MKLWTKNFILVTLSGLFVALVFYITFTTMAVYVAGKYSVSPGIAGLTAGIFVIGSVFGRLAGKGRWLRSSSAAFFILTLLYMIPVGLIPLIILRVLHGAAFGIAHGALSTIIVDFIPPERRGEGIGYFSLNFVIAIAFGPFIGMIISQHFNYVTLFAVCSLSALAGLLLAMFIPKSGSVHTNPSNRLFESSAMPMSVLIILMSMCYTSVTAFVESYAMELGLSKWAPAFFVVYGAVILLVRPYAGKMLDRRGDNIVMLPIIVFFGISLIMLAMTKNMTLFFLAAVFMALGYGNILNVGQTIMVKASPKERIGVATSTYFAFSDSGMGLGPLVMGLVVSWKGYSAMYLVTAGICAVGLILYWFTHGNKARLKIVD
ncbi:MAG: MFS transporter [Clostridiales bacterium]|nr:MFS transporter [Clostridiales bacterium]